MMNIKGYKVWIKYLLITTVAFLMGFISKSIIDPILQTTVTETRNSQNYRFINPLLECESSNFSQNAALQPLRNQLNDSIENTDNKQVSHVSVYYRDLNNGPWIGIDENENFSPASLVKVPLMIAYFKAAETDPGLLGQTIPVPGTFNHQQTILPQITLTPNQTYTVEELINRMIIYSDNQAYELLQEYIDNQILVKTYTDLGIDISQAYDDPTGNIISVKSYASFFRILFNASYLNKDTSEKALKLLSQTKYDQGIVKGVADPLISVSNKFGERTYLETGERQLHDCGIVYAPAKPYLLCIMTRGSNFPLMEKIINDVSSLVFQTVNSQI